MPIFRTPVQKDTLAKFRIAIAGHKILPHCLHWMESVQPFLPIQYIYVFTELLSQMMELELTEQKEEQDGVWKHVVF